MKQFWTKGFYVVLGNYNRNEVHYLNRIKENPLRSTQYQQKDVTFIIKSSSFSFVKKQTNKRSKVKVS